MKMTDLCSLLRMGFSFACALGVLCWGVLRINAYRCCNSFRLTKYLHLARWRVNFERTSGRCSAANVYSSLIAETQAMISFVGFVGGVRGAVKIEMKIGKMSHVSLSNFFMNGVALDDSIELECFLTRIQSIAVEGNRNSFFTYLLFLVPTPK